MAFYKTSGFKYFQNLIFGFGAAIVMIGAASKITHQDIFGISGNLWILVGLGTEALLFAFSGLIPPHEDYYWQKLYPGLDDHQAPMDPHILNHVKEDSTNATASLDKMLDKAKIDQNSINKLGDNLKALGENVSSMSSIASAGAASDTYTQNAKAAAEALASVKSSYSSAAEAMSKLANASEDTAKYHEQVQVVTKNLASLNAVYELELQDTNQHLKAMNKFYGTLSQTLGTLEDSVEDSKIYKENMAKLANNLQKLNSVYGNMLGAMRGTEA
ncbi:MAG: gliding motility protein GldL [Chitinophagales bacterium]